MSAEAIKSWLATNEIDASISAALRAVVHQDGMGEPVPLLAIAEALKAPPSSSPAAQRTKAEVKAWLAKYKVDETLGSALNAVIKEGLDKPNPLLAIAAKLAGGAPAAGKKQGALVFAKPHANTPAVREMVAKKFDEMGISVVTDGEIAGPKIDADKLIDQHYYAIASKATILPAAELPVPAEKFSENFGEEWATVLAEGRAFNAMATCEHLGIDVPELNRLWKETKAVKFGGGFYCGALKQEDKPTIYTFNAFFMSMRSKFTDPAASIHYYVVEFDPATLAWADFRGKVLGPTDPAAAPDDSLRGMCFKTWKDLGLTAEPNTGDNAVHASASPFEGMAERTNWLKTDYSLETDEFAQILVSKGIPADTIKAWSVDPQVKYPAGSEKEKGSLFDAVEDMDLDACVEKLVAINAA